MDVMEVIYKKVMGSEMDIGAIFMFEKQPPLEPIPKEAKEQKEEGNATGELSEEEEKVRDDETEPSDDEGDKDEGGFQGKARGTE